MTATLSRAGHPRGAVRTSFGGANTISDGVQNVLGCREYSVHSFVKAKGDLPLLRHAAVTVFGFKGDESELLQQDGRTCLYRYVVHVCFLQPSASETCAAYILSYSGCKLQ